MDRWYVVTRIGARTHLGLNIDISSAATTTLIPAQFRHRSTAKHNYKSGFQKEKKTVVVLLTKMQIITKIIITIVRKQFNEFYLFENRFT